MLGFAASRFLKASANRRNQAGDDRSYASQHINDAAAGTGTTYTSDPTYTGSDYGAETPFSHADVVPPVGGSDAAASETVTEVVSSSNPSDNRRRSDPLP